MRSTLPFLLAGLVAVRAQAPDSLPECGQTCVNNMLEVAVSGFGCDADDLASCACCNADFGFGIRDCSRQVCGDGSDDYNSVVSYGSSYCASAVSTCSSGTLASSVLASATSSGSGTGSTASESAATPAVTSGPLAAAVGAVSSVSGSSDAYVIGGDNTITAGGDDYDEDGTAYSALPSGGGVLVSNEDTQTTYVPGSGASGMSTMTSNGTSGGAAGGALAAAASDVSTVSGSSDVYVVDEDNTISPGGETYDNDGTVYSALPSGGGVLVSADGASSTVNPASVSASTTGSGTSSGTDGSGSASSTAEGGSGGGAANQDDSDSDAAGANGESGNFAPVQTAAPALIGAAAMAILAL